MSTTIDYRALLVKYMSHVIHNEGTSSLDDSASWHVAKAREGITDRELLALVEIANAIDFEDNPGSRQRPVESHLLRWPFTDTPQPKAKG